MPEVADLPVVVGLGVVDPDLVNPVLGGHCRFVAEPTEADLAQAQGAIVRADALVDNEFLARTPRLRVLARTGVGVERVDLDAATARGIAVVITPGAGTTRGRRGRHRDGDAPGQAIRPADHPGQIRPVGDPRHRVRSATSTARSSVSSATAGSDNGPPPSAPRWA